MTRALLLLLIVSSLGVTTARAADDTVYFWSCSAEDGYCYDWTVGESIDGGLHWNGSVSLTIYGNCTVSTNPIQATESVGWSGCVDYTMSASVSAWAGYINNTPNKLGYVISDGILYTNPSTGASVLWEGWYRRYCNGTFVKNEPPFVWC
jgi:hypothetical protein